MGRRGFISSLNSLSKQMIREAERARRESDRRQKAAVRDAERTRKAAEAAVKSLARANEAERKQLAKEAQEAHVEAMLAETERLNLDLAETYEDLDTLLAATLEVDDHVDLNTLRTPAVHPPFDRPDLEVPSAIPQRIPNPPEPVCALPPEPTGLAKLFRMKRHERTVAQAVEAHERALAAWRSQLEEVARQRESQARNYEKSEARRVAALAREKQRYADECVAREARAAEQNAEIDRFEADLGYGAVEAVQEYVSIVLGNSVYPQHFQVTHDYTFDPKSAELRLKVRVPGPNEIPDVKAYKYNKSGDEITKTQLSQKACKDIYQSAIHQVAIRSFHEVFEADRRGIIRTIALEVGTETTDPATGRQTYIPFVSAGAERDAFLQLNLGNVVPAATLSLLGAAVSKDPYSLVPANTKGVRRA